MSEQEILGQRIASAVEGVAAAATARLHINGKHGLPYEVDLELSLIHIS